MSDTKSMRMRATAAGPDGTFVEGQTYHFVPAGFVAELVAGGYAEEVAPRRDAAQPAAAAAEERAERPSEDASHGPAENAAGKKKRTSTAGPKEKR